MKTSSLLSFASLRLCAFAFIFAIVHKVNAKAQRRKDAKKKKVLCFLLPSLLFGNWAEDTLAKMSLDQKIGQLFVAPACPKRGADHFESWQTLLTCYHIGNAIVKQSDPLSQVHFLNQLQKESALPILVMADAEWGLAMRMTDTIAFPKNKILGKVQDLQLIEALGAEIGRQAKCVGIHLNLAPVADVNNNPANIVIGDRSFGDDPVAVSDRVAAFIRGQQKAGVSACAKHFPGHGDTHVDSHRDLPVISHSLQRLEAIEFPPFRKAIDAGVHTVMTAHLYVPAIDATYPTSLSRKCTQLLREELHFEGLIISDALNMKALSDRYSPEEIAVLARKAGCDLLLYGAHLDPAVDALIYEMIPRGWQALKEAYLKGELSLEELDRTVLAILRRKEGLSRFCEVEGLAERLNTPEALSLKERLFKFLFYSEL
jgi:beta-N-acetylhexosaminidase